MTTFETGMTRPWTSRRGLVSGRALALACTLGVSCFPASALQAGVELKGKAFDGEESSRVLLDAMRRGQTYNEGLKSPLKGQELLVDLFEAQADGTVPATARKSWKVTTGEDGSFQLDSGLDRWPESGLITARTVLNGTKLYTSFLKPSTDVASLHLYPSTENSSELSINVKVVYDVYDTAAGKMLRVRCGARVRNQGGLLYVGRRAGTGYREIWRLPLPRDAEILVNTGPIPGAPGWKISNDRTIAVVDTPIPGVCDFQQNEEFFELHYTIPARQRLFQSFPVPVSLEPRALTVWCSHDTMRLSSEALDKTSSGAFQDPFTGEQRSLDVVYSGEHLHAGSMAAVELRVDNVAIGQAVNVGALKWVGGFVLVCILAVLLGLAFGPRGPTADQIIDHLPGEDVLDRLAQLDLRKARGEISDADHRKLREPLLALAAEELAGGAPAAVARGPGAEPSVPESVRPLLKRIEEIEREGIADPARLTERIQLLEALARALREGSRG